MELLNNGEDAYVEGIDKIVIIFNIQKFEMNLFEFGAVIYCLVRLLSKLNSELKSIQSGKFITSLSHHFDGFIYKCKSSRIHEVSKKQLRST